MATKHVRIVGRVQSVSFRAWTRDRAQELGVSGWVRNLPDGSVEALVSGASEAVDVLLAAFHEGPSAAEVNDVQASDTKAHVERGFRVRG
ncbi:MAG: acylphosphatase [Pelagibaca sp.]